MSIRPQVRQAQRAIAALDAAHRQAAARLEEALARRAEVIADQDHLVSVAQAASGRAVADMAPQLSAELGAQLLGLEPAEVRRLAKAYPPLAAGQQAHAVPRLKAQQ
jgi:hypothetical protein